MQVENRRELLASYVSQTKTQLEVIKSLVRELPHILKPIITEEELQNVNVFEQYAENISLLKQFYYENDYFISGIKAHNTLGNVFSIYFYNDEEFIMDVYMLRNVGNLRSEIGIVLENNSYNIVIPVFHENNLIGNVEVAIDLLSLKQKLYAPYLENDNLWLTTIFDGNDILTFPLEEEWEWVLSHERNIIWGIYERKPNFVQGKVSGLESSYHVVTYYENLMITGHNIGIAISSNITPLIFSSLFALICIISLLGIITFAASFILNRIIVQNLETVRKKDQEIRLLQTIYHYSPVGIFVNENNKFFSGNNCFFTLLDGYISMDDVGKRIDDLNFPASFHHKLEQEFEDWDLCKFISNDWEVCIGRRQMNFTLGVNHYVIDTLWDLTEMEKCMTDTIQSSITKSELLTRVSDEVKKSLDRVRDITISLTEETPDEVRIASILRSISNLSERLTDVQDYARIEAGNVELVEMPFNIVNEVKKMIDVYSLETQPKGVELQTIFASSSVRNVVGDPQYFRQILNELLSNAVKFTQKGKIRISIETVDLLGGKIMIKCSIDDTGQGMPREKLKKLFSFDLRVMEEGDSIGLGIIMVKHLVELMGGTLRVTSPSPISTDPNAPGMQFSFSIICYWEQPFDKQLDYSSLVSFIQINVLIITSDELHMQYLTTYLNRKGINSDTFIYSKDSSELLLQKLVIDQDRYQMVVIAAESSETSYAIAEEIYRRKLTNNCIYLLVDTNNKKNSYIKAKSFYIDYYLVKKYDLPFYDSILKTHFPSINTQPPDGIILKRRLIIQPKS